MQPCERTCVYTDAVLHSKFRGGGGSYHLPPLWPHVLCHTLHTHTYTHTQTDKQTQKNLRDAAHAAST